MRFSNRGILALTLSSLCWAGASTATTLLDIPGPTIGFADFGDSALADPWTQNFSVTNGSISVYVQGLEPSGGPINFYLTTDIGPSATLSDLVAFNSLQVPFALTQVTPFQNLSLGPGNYYLILADYTPNNTGVDGPDWNYYAGESAIQTAPGLTFGAGLEAFPLGPFAPAATFQPIEIDIRGVVSYTGTVVPTTTVPEPSTLVLFAFALMALGIAPVRRILMTG